MDKPREVPFQRLHPEVAQLFDDILLMVLLKEKLMIMADDNSNIPQFLKIVDGLRDHFIAQACKAYPQLEILDQSRITQA